MNDYQEDNSGCLEDDEFSGIDECHTAVFKEITEGIKEWLKKDIQTISNFIKKIIKK